MTTKKAARRLIASALNLDPHRIAMEGQIPSDFRPLNHEDLKHTPIKEVHEMFGFSTVGGLKRLSIDRDFRHVTKEGGSFGDGETISEYLKRNGEEYDYFVIHHYGTEHMQEYSTWGLYSGKLSAPAKQFGHFVLIDSVNVSDNDINDEIIHVMCMCPEDVSGAEPIGQYHEFNYCSSYNHNKEYPKWFLNPDWSSNKTNYSGLVQPVNYTFEECERQWKEAAAENAD